MKNKILIPLFAAICSLVLSSCDSHGSKLMFNKGELFYKDGVTEDEAKKLGEYLVEDGFFDGVEKSAQIAKDGEKYQFRMVTKKDFLNDSDFEEVVGTLASQLSSNVFDGAETEVHLCDEHLKTEKVVAAAKPKVVPMLVFNKGELCYSGGVTEEEAKKLGEYLVENEFFDGVEKTVKITKDGAKYQFLMVTLEEFLNNAEFAGNAATMAGQLSNSVFGGAETELHFCNAMLETQKVIQAAK